MNDTTLKQIPIAKIKKFWAILERLDRHMAEYYPNNKCQKEVFCKRVSDLLPKGYMVINHINSDQCLTITYSNGKSKKIRKNEIIYFGGFRYNLSWNDNILIGNIKLEYNDLIYFQYRYFTAEETNVYINLIGSEIYKHKVYNIKRNVSLKKIQSFLEKENISHLNENKIKILADYNKDELFLSAIDSDRFKKGEIINLEDYEVEVIQTIK